MPQKMMLHTGEFARLVGVNKKTLHYYDAQGVFRPDSVAENGYRCYSMRQLYTFHMIRMLREMGLSLEEIRSYLQERTPERFADLLQEQQIWLKKEIRRYERMRRIVINQLALLQTAKELCYDEVQEEELPAACLILTKNVHGLREAEEMQELQEHENYCLQHELNEGGSFGAMTSREDFMRNGQENQTSFYFTSVRMQSLRAVEKSRCHVRPAGHYIIAYQKGDYMDLSLAYQKLRAYLTEHDLQPGSYAYEESILEDMSTPEPEEYVTRIAIPVQT